MLHPLNMDRTFYFITTNRGVRRVSNKMYVISAAITGDFERYAGRMVRLISLSEHSMPGDHPTSAAMAVVALNSLAKNGFDVIGNADAPGTMGINLADLKPLLVAP